LFDQFERLLSLAQSGLSLLKRLPALL
jgi:hypothetical protein